MKQTIKHKTMKTNLKTASSHNAKMILESTIWIIAITLLFIIFSSTNSLGNNLNFKDEAYIDDIPFDTETVVHEMNITNVDFEDEAYIDDIPFNTAYVTANCNYLKAMAVDYELEDENFINDIPFNTEKVTEVYTYSKAVSIEFQLTDEKYIDDIPFNTGIVVLNYNKVNLNDLYARQK